MINPLENDVYLQFLNFTHTLPFTSGIFLGIILYQVP
jgi:hypothetical protein